MVGHRRNLMTINLLNDLGFDLDMFHKMITLTCLLFKAFEALGPRFVTAVVMN